MEKTNLILADSTKYTGNKLRQALVGNQSNTIFRFENFNYIEHLDDCLLGVDFITIKQDLGKGSYDIMLDKISNYGIDMIIPKKVYDLQRDKWLFYCENKDTLKMPKTSLDYNELSFPILIKNRYSFDSSIIVRCDTVAEIESFLTTRAREDVMFQEYIECANKSVNLLLIDGKFIKAIEKCSVDDGIDSSRTTWDLIRAYDITANMKIDAENLTQKLDCIYLGIDLLVDANNNYYFIGINPNASMEYFDYIYKDLDLAKMFYDATLKITERSEN